ncbi:ABC transporter ATP-binding protein [Haloechinothrix sp. YIM 98757]|uniref:ABC transporter ATP-binding protein n=1 Tax=Haloechinothrix aidingensis TaxID=2752311 RepID=A0A838AAV8_9PSEU|nr:ABC transporter ATP-binding protein [Haloechinothrix aidingensis]MBA0126374.1 ABC transporter ATP-binding protein [Haloechinothrix aidingensis]
MAAIEVQGVRKKFGKLVALDDVSFSVADGEFFCLLGPSGAGKTTTCKSVAGLVRPDEGTVRLAGHDVGDVEPNHRDLAMCFESYALYPQLNVFDNMASPLRSPRFRLSDDETRERVGRTAEMLGVAQLLHRGVDQLSNGQRQRIALGRVLVRPAEAYLLDEPLAHLDAKLRTAMRAELKSISHGDLNTTTIYVTHDYVEALSLADRIGVLREGRILQVGTPEEIWDRPCNAFVAEAFGKPRISFVDGGLVDGEHGLRFVSSDGAVEVPVPGVEATAGEAVRIGVRPHDLELHPGAEDVPAGRVWVNGVVYVLEHLGRQTEVTVQVGTALLSVVVPREDVPDLARDDRVGLSLDPCAVHVFARGEDERRISS